MVRLNMPSRYKSDLLHSQTFTNSRLHFLRWWIRLPPKWLVHFAKSLVSFVVHLFASLMCWTELCEHLGWLTVPVLCTIFWHATPFTSYQLAMNFDGGKRFTHKTQIRPWNSSRHQVSSVVDTAHHLIPWIASDRLCYLLHVALTTSASSYWKMKCFVTQSCRIGNLDPRVADSSYARVWLVTVQIWELELSWTYEGALTPLLLLLKWI